MKLTPIEIERHTFRTVWRGHDPDEVSAFLGQIAHQWTQTLSEHQKTQEQIKVQNQRLQLVDSYELLCLYVVYHFFHEITTTTGIYLCLLQKKS